MILVKDVLDNNVVRPRANRATLHAIDQELCDYVSGGVINVWMNHPFIPA